MKGAAYQIIIDELQSGYGVSLWDHKRCVFNVSLNKGFEVFRANHISIGIAACEVVGSDDKAALSMIKLAKHREKVLWLLAP